MNDTPLRRSFITLITLGMLVFALWMPQHSAALRNDAFNPLPDSNASTFRTQSRDFWSNEDAQREGRHFQPLVYSGGLPVTSASLTLLPVSTEAFVPERINQASTSFVFSTTINNICWGIISSVTTSIIDWTRVGSTAYYYQCQGNTTPLRPTLPANSAFLFYATITGCPGACAVTAINSQRAMSQHAEFHCATPGLFDQTCIINAVASLPVGSGSSNLGGGGTILLPNGRIYIASTITLLTSRVTLQGQGGTELYWTGAAGGKVLQVAEQRIALQDFRVDCASSAARGIHFAPTASSPTSSSGNSYMRNVQVQNCTGEGIANGLDDQASTLNASENYWYNIETRSNATGILIQGLFPNNTHIFGFRDSGSTVAGYYVNVPSGSGNFSLINPVFGGTGVDIQVTGAGIIQLSEYEGWGSEIATNHLKVTNSGGTATLLMRIFGGTFNGQSGVNKTIDWPLAMGRLMLFSPTIRGYVSITSPVGAGRGKIQVHDFGVSWDGSGPAAQTDFDSRVLYHVIGGTVGTGTLAANNDAYIGLGIGVQEPTALPGIRYEPTPDLTTIQQASYRQTNTVTLADVEKANLTSTNRTATDLGTVEMLVQDANYFAKYVLHGNSNVTTEITDTGTVFTPTLGNAGTFNVTFDVDKYVLENRTGVTRTIRYHIHR